MKTTSITRRHALRIMGLGAAALAVTPPKLFAAASRALAKKIPATGEPLPVIGMGTWRTFNVGGDIAARDGLVEVLETFFEVGGGMIDSSPMYGSAQEVLGYGFERIGVPDTLFSADKIWTEDGTKTVEQLEESERLWGIEKFDLIQIHNLVSWRPHLDKLRELKAEGRIRYLGITTSHGRRHEEFERVMGEDDIDFVQLTYNITHPKVEERLLPLAAEKGIAVIANRPFDGGGLVRRLKQGDYPLPPWAEEFDCHDWPGFLLKYIVSHPDVTCAIPATSRVEHMRENMRAGHGRMPDQAMRKRMEQYVRAL